MEEGRGNESVVVPPLNLLLFLKEESGVDLFAYSLPDLRDRLREGLFLLDKKENTETQFFWMDEKSNYNCFMLLPKSLRIYEEGGRPPHFIYETEVWWNGRQIRLPMVKYESVKKLYVGGKFGTMGLSGIGNGLEYEVVVFLLLIGTGRTSSIHSASTKRLSLPDGSQPQQPWKYNGLMSFGVWHPFHVGTFFMSPNNVGELSFDFQVYFWGRPDVLIKGVAFKPAAPRW